MTGLNFMNATCCYLELGHTSLHALNGEATLEMPLERQANGRLSTACTQTLTHKLPGFFRPEAWQPRPRVLCAIGARGVSLRRFSLPAVAREELARLLRLQVEKEFPLSPDELAWGYRPLGAPHPPRNGSPAQQEFLVLAVRKEVVEEYAELLSACGVTPQFTLAALARSCLCAHPPAAFAVLNIDGHQSELMTFENGIPVSVRLLSWGGEDIAQALAEKLDVSREEAVQFKARLEQASPATHDHQPQVHAALDHALQGLSRSLDGHLAGGKLYLSGKSVRNRELTARLGRHLPQVTTCEVIEPSLPGGRTAAVQGLKTLTENRSLTPPVFLQVKPTNGAVTVPQGVPWKWIKIAACLLVAILALPYLEAFVFKPHLAKQLAALKAERSRLPLIDRELEFLQYLKQNQPPYLDTLYVLAKSAPQGAKIESLSLNKRGDLSLRGSMRDVSQVAEFRKKLSDSGLFASVSLEEQAPTPDRQKLMMRMTAQIKPAAARRTLALAPTAEEIEKAKTRDRSQQGMPPMGMPSMGPMFGPGMVGMPGMPGGFSPRGSSSRRSAMGGAPLGSSIRLGPQGNMPPGIILNGAPPSQP